jgi:3-oxoacyl-[acyl-carrier protein] reductase
VNAIAPGYLATEMSGELTEEQQGQIVRRTPLGRMGRVEDVAGVVEFLLSDAAGFMTGQTLVVDGGISC